MREPKWNLTSGTLLSSNSNCLGDGASYEILHCLALAEEREEILGYEKA